MGLKFRRGSTAQQSGSLAFGEPYVNTTLGTLVVGGAEGDIILSSTGTGSTGNFGAISGSGLDITGNANIAGNLTLGGNITMGDQTSDTLNVVANLSSSLIPYSTNAFDLGSATKIWRDLYISTGSIKFVDGTTVVKELSLSTISGLESSTGSSTVSITNLNTNSASLNTSVTNINSYTSSLQTALSLSGTDVTVLGNLTVQGDTTTLNTANLLVEDKLIEIAVGSTTSAAANGAGIFISGANASILWDDSNSTLDINKSIDIAGNITLTGNVDGVDVSVFNSNVNSTTASLNTSVSNLNSFTSSINTTIKSKLDTDGVVSGSSQINVASTTGDIALGTRTSGNYVATITGGTGVTSNGATSGEGIAHTISIGQAVATSDNVRFASIGVGMAASGTSGRIDAANDVVAFSTSDIRLKENIKPIENALDKISKISGNTYDWKAELKDVHGYDGNDVGVIAQEVEAVLPQLVQDRDNGYKAVKYDKLVALLIEGIKEQQTQIHNLTLEIENLKKNNSL